LVFDWRIVFFNPGFVLASASAQFETNEPRQRIFDVSPLRMLVGMEVCLFRGKFLNY
jgi:hypothetical protein